MEQTDLAFSPTVLNNRKYSQYPSQNLALRRLRSPHSRRRGLSDALNQIMHSMAYHDIEFSKLHRSPFSIKLTNELPINKYEPNSSTFIQWPWISLPFLSIDKLVQAETLVIKFGFTPSELISWKHSVLHHNHSAHSCYKCSLGNNIKFQIFQTTHLKKTFGSLPKSSTRRMCIQCHISASHPQASCHWYT